MTSKPDFKVMVILLVFMHLTRDLFAIAKFLLYKPIVPNVVRIHNSVPYYKTQHMLAMLPTYDNKTLIIGRRFI